MPDGGHVSAIGGDDDGVFPTELQADDHYTRAGKGSLGAGDIDDPHAEHKRTDFDGSLRDFNFDDTDALDDVARCFKYWIALTDCDGFRLDTLKHVSAGARAELLRRDQGVRRRTWARRTSSWSARWPGSDDDAAALSRRARGEPRTRRSTSAGRAESSTRWPRAARTPGDYFDAGCRLGSGARLAPQCRRAATSRSSTTTTMSPATRSASRATPRRTTRWWPASRSSSSRWASPASTTAPSRRSPGPRSALRDQFLPDYNAGNPPPDKYLREAMFGPEHPALEGAAGLQAGAGGLDTALPGFRAFRDSGSPLLRSCRRRRSCASPR